MVANGQKIELKKVSKVLEKKLYSEMVMKPGKLQRRLQRVQNLCVLSSVFMLIRYELENQNVSKKENKNIQQ